MAAVSPAFYTRESCVAVPDLDRLLLELTSSLSSTRRLLSFDLEQELDLQE